MEEFNSIFFDDSSKQWEKNKIKLNNGTYSYKCSCKTLKGTLCKKKAYFSIEYIFQKNMYCKIHQKKYNKEYKNNKNKL